jgi:hypothetical protein
MVGLAALVAVVELQLVLAVLVQVVKVMQVVLDNQPLLNHIEAVAVAVLAL